MAGLLESAAGDGSNFVSPTHNCSAMFSHGDIVPDFWLVKLDISYIFCTNISEDLVPFQPLKSSNFRERHTPDEIAALSMLHQNVDNTTITYRLTPGVGWH